MSEQQPLPAWNRYILLFGGMFVTGAICAIAIPALRSARGVVGPTIAQAERPMMAALAVVICFTLATGVAVVVGRQLNAVIGLFVLGAGVGVLSLRSGTVVDLAFAAGSLEATAIETLFWAVMVLGATFVMLRLSEPLHDFVADSDHRDPHGLSGLATTLAVLPLMWLLARSPLRGQTLGAAITAMLLVGLAARLVSPHASPRWLFAAPIVLGAVGHLIAALGTKIPLDQAWIQHDLTQLAYPRPVDYAAGSLMGIAMGLGWARSFVHPEHEDTGEDGTRRPIDA